MPSFYNVLFLPKSFMVLSVLRLIDRAAEEKGGEALHCIIGFAVVHFY